MSRVLAVTWDGGGNVPPLLGIVAELVGRGDEVRVLGHPRQEEVATAAGADFHAYRHARAFSPLVPRGTVRFAADYLATFTDPGPGRDVADHAGWADAVLVDALLPAAVHAAVRSGVPTAVLAHTFVAYLQRWARGPVGIAAALRGRNPARGWSAADVVLAATDRELDPARSTPANVRYTGVVGPGARPACPGEPLVLVSLSTIDFAGQQAAVQAVLDALDGLGVRGFLTTGPAVDPVGLRVPAAVEVHRFAPHADVMRRASVVVGHGGHGTTMLALAHDLPVLVLPLHPQLDQPLVGRAVADAGAGRVLRPTAGAGAIRAALVELLADGPHRRAAATVGARLRERSGAAAAADVIGGLRPREQKRS
ncbi:glycosyltransferase [Actinomycetospora chiangmaiensis]|uniref:glycosyltransferase n=1 Tax=Actinomycetospora chiangmaiensis TaxID=402650 RepID=UPI00036762B7|nr:glycosyltransferase [Actinomycetospora chiangmaiensis]